MAQSLVRYQNVLMDSARWEDVRFRDGDIVISTPAKCGTTWTQMICALLIFQTPRLPQPMDALSVWPDMLIRRQDEILSELESQRHRRFLKTHTPFDGLPYDERVTYICVARDPRDCAISWDHHMANTDFDVVMSMRAAAVGVDDLPEPDGDGPPGLPPPAESARDRFWQWVDTDDIVVGLSAMMHHLSSFWRARHLPNMVLLHYDDMKADLEGQMRGLAGRLGIEVPASRWPELVRAATFDEMRGRPTECAPELAIWRDPQQFFHSGTSGQWLDMLDADDVRRYEAKLVTLAEADLVAWVHRGPISA